MVRQTQRLPASGPPPGRREGGLFRVFVDGVDVSRQIHGYDPASQAVDMTLTLGAKELSLRSGSAFFVPPPYTRRDRELRIEVLGTTSRGTNPVVALLGAVAIEPYR